MFINSIILSIILLSGMFFAVKARKLTVEAALSGALIAVSIYVCSGFKGVALMTSFFLLGTMATSWKRKKKELLGLEEEHKERRKASQVFANAGVAGLAGVLAFFFPGMQHICPLMIAACFASATADTLSSEMGNVYGSRFYNILTFKNDERGLDGVISLEGTLFGFAGSAAIAALYSVFYGKDHVLLVFFAGICGNLADSILGASLQKRHVLNNDWVNFLNTLIAVLFALGIHFYFS